MQSTTTRLFTNTTNHIKNLIQQHYKIISPKYFSTTFNLYKKKIGVQGACLELGQQKTGAADGPKKLRDTKFIDVLRNVVNIDIIDYGDINLTRHLTNPPGQMFYTDQEIKPIVQRNNAEQQNFILTHRLWKEPVHVLNINEIGVATDAIAESTETILKDNRICVTLGGDHSISIGTLRGTTKVFGDNIGVIWIDAHSDLNTPLTTNSGNIHGMAMSFSLIEMIPYMTQFPAFINSSPCIKARSIVYIGLRDVEPYEKAFLEQFNIKAFSMKEIDQIGINGIIERTMDYLLPAGIKRPLHVSLDVDSIDPHDIPCTGTPVPGGLTLREGMHLLEEIEKTGYLKALDVVELNPSLGTEIEATRSAQATEELIFSCFQYYRGGMASSGVKPPLAIKE